MITMNQMDANDSTASHYFGTVRIIFGSVLVAVGGVMALLAIMADATVAPMLVVLGSALLFVVVGVGLLMHQGWALWGFILVGGMTVLGAAEAAIRPSVLARSVAWSQPTAVIFVLFFAWGLWTLTRPAARAELKAGHQS